MFISIYQIDTNKAMYIRFADQVNPYGITRQVIEGFDIGDKDGSSDEFIVCCARVGDGDEY